MGTCTSTPKPASGQGTTEADVHKVLLLGPGETGKSTVFKQLHRMYLNGFEENEQQDYINIVYSNILEGMRVLCQESNKSAASNQAKEYFEHKVNGDEELDEVLAKRVADLWQDPEIQEAWSRRSEFHVCESVGYFFGKVHELAGREHRLTDQDILMAHVRTTGIVEQEFAINGLRYHVIDVGGQRRERQKWHHCMKQVSGVVFVASLADYELTLVEDEKTNRLNESIGLFQEICQMEELANARIVLLLNKQDLFRQRLAVKPLREVLDYLGPEDVDSAVEWIKKRFEAVYTRDEATQPLQIHVVSATSGLESVFGSVASHIAAQDPQAGSHSA